jgi:hypothetical protein
MSNPDLTDEVWNVSQLLMLASFYHPDTLLASAETCTNMRLVETKQSTSSRKS